MKFILQTFFKGLYYILTDKNFRTFVRLSIVHGSSRRYVRKKISIPGARLTVADARSFVWQFYEIYFKGYYRFESKEKHPVILDCGSNIGLSILDFKQQHPQSEIHAFEPDPTIFEILSSNLKENQLSGIFLNNEAVWIRNEDLHFASEGADGGQISDKGIHVKGIDLNEYMSRMDRIDFMKMDIEGAEADVLPHITGQLHKVKNFFVEFHSYNDSPQQLNKVIAAMSSAGHRIYIDNVNFKQAPFLNKKGKYGMDLQLNIFAWKD